VKPTPFLALILIFFSSLNSSFADSSGLRLFAWRAHPATPQYVIAVRPNETPRQAAERYIAKLQMSPELLSLFPTGIPKMQFEEFEPISQSRFATQALLIANRGSDYDTQSKRVVNFASLYASAPERAVTQTYLLPIAADLGLTASEAKELRRLVARSFSLLTAMGGHDADPGLYEEENRFSRNVVPARDRFEIELIRDYTSLSEGFMVGVCRGHQMTSIALGYKLIQDLPKENPSEVGHAEGHHGIELVNTGFGFLNQATNGNRSVTVNTLHHQAVVYRSGGPMTPAAYSPDGVIEALEFRNGRGLTMQFHPELMTNDLGRRIMHTLVRAKNKTLSRACRALFKAA
jgi:putative glutamine amidotransferase